MFEYREIPDTNIIEFTIDGGITAEEFDELLARFTAAIEQHGTVRLLEHIRSLGMFPPTRLWEDIKFGFTHLSEITHAAVVADPKWIEVLSNVLNPLLKMEVRHFDAAHIDEAREWLKTAE